MQAHLSTRRSTHGLRENSEAQKYPKRLGNSHSKWPGPCFYGHIVELKTKPVSEIIAVTETNSITQDWDQSFSISNTSTYSHALPYRPDFEHLARVYPASTCPREHKNLSESSHSDASNPGPVPLFRFKSAAWSRIFIDQNMIVSGWSMNEAGIWFYLTWMQEK